MARMRNGQRFRIVIFAARSRGNPVHYLMFTMFADVYPADDQGRYLGAYLYKIAFAPLST